MKNKKSQQKWTIVIVLIILTCAPCLQAESSTLSVTIHEPDSNKPLPCRAWIQANGEQLFNPVTKSCIPYKKDRSFTCDGHFDIEVPPGKATIHVERGKEYRPVDKEVLISNGQTTKVDITLERWINMRKQGWYSLDIHCHFGVGDLRILKQLALADDINIEPALALWNNPWNNHKNVWTDLMDQTAGYTWPHWPQGPNFYADPTHLITMRNQEIERIGGKPFDSVGALLMFGLTKPVKFSPQKYHPCDAVLAQIAKKTSPQCIIDADKPLWSHNVVGMALGLFDSVQLCHNHYRRKSTIPLCCGMASADIEDQQKDWGKDELFHRTNSTYYRFLNCGFKLAATGGAATGVMGSPLGYNRTYLKLEGPLTEAAYLKAIHAGRTFATSGPMLIITANGRDAGAKIQYSTSNSNPIQIKAELKSIQPLDSLELIHNGNVTKKIDLRNWPHSPLLQQSIAMSLSPKDSGWVAARTTFTAPDGHLRQAHTSPIYFTVDGKPTASKKDAEYMIRWIDRLLEVIEKPAIDMTSEQRAESQAVFLQAKDLYHKIAATDSGS